MDINYLNEFCVLAQTCNYLEASERLYISQSSLSKHIQHIERELGVILFNRTTRRIQLSDYGLLFLPYAKAVAQAQKDYTCIIENYKRNIIDRITIASFPVMDQYGIAKLVSAFQSQYPDITLYVREAFDTDALDLLNENKCNFAFVREHECRHDGLSRIPYVEDTLCIVLPASHNLANERQIELSDLKDEQFLLVDKNTHLYDNCIEACNLSGFVPSVVYTGHRLETIVSMVGFGMGVSIMSNTQARLLKTNDVAVVEMIPSFRTTISLCYDEKKILSNGCSLFLSYFQKYMNERDSKCK